MNVFDLCKRKSCVVFLNFWGFFSLHNKKNHKHSSITCGKEKSQFWPVSCLTSSNTQLLLAIAPPTVPCRKQTQPNINKTTWPLMVGLGSSTSERSAGSTFCWKWKPRSRVILATIIQSMTLSKKEAQINSETSGSLLFSWRFKPF